MALISTKEILKRAQAGAYAVGAFNFENMEMAMAVIDAAAELRAPVILQTTPSTVRYAGLDMFYAIVAALAEKSPYPVALHLDHGESFELAAAAIEAGYSSVMIDGSPLSLEVNIALSRRVSESARAAGVSVEAELGRVGGKEDDHDGGNGGYTDPLAALEFIKGSGVDSLAVAIGTSHGVYSGAPILDVARLRKIKETLGAAGCDIPLVLHGASGLSDAAVRECIAAGICKVNFATELRQAYTAGVRGVLADGDVYDPKKYGAAGMCAVREVVMARIRVCGCEGKAPGSE